MIADIFLQKQQEQREHGSQRHDPLLSVFNLNASFAVNLL
jgi:hypothetical protein